MSDHIDPERIVEDAQELLDDAERSDDEARLQALEELHDALDRELSSDQASAAGR